MYTVLLVDDEEKILEVMKVRIGWQELGVDKLLTASDGQAALEYFEQQRIDLLLALADLQLRHGLFTDQVALIDGLLVDDAAASSGQGDNGDQQEVAH